MKKTIMISAELDDRFRKFREKYSHGLTREETFEKMLLFCELVVPVLKNREKHQIPIYLPKDGIVANGVYDQVGSVEETIVMK